MAARWCGKTTTEHAPLPGPGSGRVRPSFCQILSGEQRDLLSYPMRKLRFLSHNPHSNVSPRLVSTIRTMPPLPLLALCQTGWNAELLSPDQKNRNPKLRLVPGVFWWSSRVCVSLPVLLCGSLRLRCQNLGRQHGLCAASSTSHEKVPWIQIFRARRTLPFTLRSDATLQS